MQVSVCEVGLVGHFLMSRLPASGLALQGPAMQAVVAGLLQSPVSQLPAPGSAWQGGRHAGN